MASATARASDAAAARAVACSPGVPRGGTSVCTVNSTSGLRDRASPTAALSAPCQSSSVGKAMLTSAGVGGAARPGGGGNRFGGV